MIKPQEIVFMAEIKQHKKQLTDLENRLKINESAVLGVMSKFDDLKEQLEQSIAFIEEEKVDEDHRRLTKLSKRVLELAENLLHLMESLGYTYKKHEEEEEEEEPPPTQAPSSNQTGD
jgi:vacuolar-type H+-ATPase subunit I/STV1